MSYPGDETEVAELRQQMHELMRAIGTVPTNEIKQRTETLLKRNSAVLELAFTDLQKIPDKVVAKWLNVSIDEAPKKLERYRKATPKELLEEAFTQLEDMSAEDVKALIFSMQNQFRGRNAKDDTKQ